MIYIIKKTCRERRKPSSVNKSSFYENNFSSRRIGLPQKFTAKKKSFLAAFIMLLIRFTSLTAVVSSQKRNENKNTMMNPTLTFLRGKKDLSAFLDLKSSSV